MRIPFYNARRYDECVNPFRYDIPDIEKKAVHIREDIIRMLVTSGSGHSAGPLGMADVFAALFFAILSYDPQNPEWKDRDRFVLSCGHICPVLYATLAHAGFFPVDELMSLRKFGSRLQGHPSRVDLPGVEASSGPLGQGISQALGMALALRHDHSASRVYCVTSDGEHNEGQLWEAVMFAAKYKLGNLTVIVDRNDIQIDGYTHHVMPLEPLREKYESFNWHVIEIDGHSINEILDALETAQTIRERPTCIIAHTIPGKGVDFMEKKFEWHGKTPSQEEAYQALLELRTLGGQLEHE